MKGSGKKVNVGHFYSTEGAWFFSWNPRSYERNNFDFSDILKKKNYLLTCLCTVLILVSWAYGIWTVFPCSWAVIRPSLMLATFLKSLVQCVNSHRFICLKGGRKTGKWGWLLVEPDRHDVSDRLVEEIPGLDPPGQLLEQQLPLLLHLGQHLTVLVGPAHAPVSEASYSI